MAKKKFEKPPEQGAPAYMTMYTSLMMLLLAFFIALISMATSTTQSAGLQAGIGVVRNSFGMEGGLGLLPYIKMFQNLRDIYPRVQERTEQDEVERSLIGHDKDTIREDIIIDEGFLRVEPFARGISLRITTPIVFAPGSAALDPDARVFLQRMGGILNSFPEGVLTVRAFASETGRPDSDELLATERAAAIVRFMRQQSAIVPERLQAVGHASRRYLDVAVPGQDQQVLFYINKMTERVSMAARAPDVAAVVDKE